MFADAQNYFDAYADVSVDASIAKTKGDIKTLEAIVNQIKIVKINMGDQKKADKGEGLNRADNINIFFVRQCTHGLRLWSVMLGWQR